MTGVHRVRFVTVRACSSFRGRKREDSLASPTFFPNTDSRRRTMSHVCTLLYPLYCKTRIRVCYEPTKKVDMFSSSHMIPFFRLRKTQTKCEPPCIARKEKNDDRKSILCCTVCMHLGPSGALFQPCPIHTT